MSGALFCYFQIIGLISYFAQRFILYTTGTQIIFLLIEIVFPAQKLCTPRSLLFYVHKYLM